MADIDMLSAREQNILLWMAETEAGVAEPLAVPPAELPSERVNATIDRLVSEGFLSRKMPWMDHDRSSPSASLTMRGALVVLEVWRRRLAVPPNARAR